MRTKQYCLILVLSLLLPAVLAGCHKSETGLTPTRMRQDFEFLAQTIEDVHPAGALGLSVEQRQAIYDGRQRLAAEQPTYADYFSAVSSIISALNDRHSRLVWPADDKALNLPLFWCLYGLYLTRAAGNLQPGDRVLSIGGQSTENYEPRQMLAPYLPCAGSADGYEIGGMLTSQRVLESLKLIGADGKVTVEIQRGEQKQTLQLAFSEDYQPQQAGPERAGFGWSLDPENSLGIFYLDKLIIGSGLEQQLHDFFAAVRAQNLQNVVLDLRYNQGGDWQAAQEFLRYLDVASYVDYRESVRSPGEAEMQTQRPQQISNSTYSELVFSGKLYTLVSGATLDSACRLAVVLYYNQLAQLVGQGPGDAPIHYGKAQVFNLPASKLQFTLSTTEFLPPGGGSINDRPISSGPSSIPLADMLAGVDIEMRMVRIMSQWGDRLYQEPATAPLISLQGKTLEQAAREWLEAVHLPLKADTVSPQHRLADFSIQLVEQADPAHGYDRLVRVQYSLKPAYLEFWQSGGNGIWDGAWLNHEERFLIFSPEGDLYRVTAATGL